VALWLGPHSAAVLHIRRRQDEEDPEPFSEVDVALYSRTDGIWQGGGGGGAGGWSGDALARWQLPARAVQLDGKLAGGEVVALWGEVGVDAAFAEVEQDGVLTRRPVEAPTGHYVVSADFDRPFTVRVFDAGGALLSQREESAGSVFLPPWMR